MSGAVYFASDLHLAAERPRQVERFDRFLREECAGSGGLYLLGDLFDYWIGADEDADPVVRTVLDALAAASRSGLPIAFVTGNRDFLFGRRAAALARVRLLDVQTVIDLHGVPTLVSHGDELCTDDAAYQRFRRRVRNPLTMALLRALPLSGRRAIVRSMREKSESDKRAKSMSIMDVSDAAVADAFRRHGVSRMIHGHTHRPALHRLTVDGRACERHVLADWYERASCLRATAAGLESVALD